MIYSSKITLTITIFFSVLNIIAQNGDCDLSVAACTNPSFNVDPANNINNVIDFTTLDNISNPLTNPNNTPGNAGCMQSGELNPTWLLITISSTGTLEFSMGTAGSFNCYDWIMWPYNSTACADIQSNTLSPISCNWNGACNGITGMANNGNIPAGGDPADFEDGINVNPGDQFMVCFSNFSSASTNIPLDFFGTATVSCGSITNPFICFGDTAIIAALDGVSYVWDQTVPGFINTNAAGDTAYVNPLITTDYPVQIILLDGSFILDTSTVTVYDQIISTTTNVNEACLNGNDGSITTDAPLAVMPITFTLSGASTATNSTGIFTNLSPGNYTIDLIDGNGCTSQVTTTLDEGPRCCETILTTTQINNLCYGDCLGSILLDTSETYGPSTIQWFDTSGTPIAGANGLSISNLCSGTYSVEVTDLICTVTETVTITEPMDLTLTVNLTDLTCFQNASGILEILSSGGTGNIQFSIDNGNTFDPNPLFTGLASGNYDIVIMDANGCLESTTVSLIEPVELTASFVATDNTCNSLNGPCDGILTVSRAGGTAPFSYNWTGTSSTTNISTNLCVNNYDITIIDSNNCSVSLIGMSISEPPAITIDNLNLTPPRCTDFCDGLLEIDHSNASIFSIDGGNSDQPTNVFNNLCPGPIQIVISDINGCFIDSALTIINPLAVVSSFEFGPQPTSIFNPDILLTSTAINSTTHYWTHSDGSSISEVYEFEPTVSFPNDVPGIYEVCLIALDANLCVDTSCNEIVIDDEFFIFTPNAFSPNGDGINDEFSPTLRSFDVNQFKMTIFNRWGQQIFYTQSIDNKWDGTFKSSLVEIGVYVWKIEVFSIAENELKQYYGHISVIR